MSEKTLLRPGRRLPERLRTGLARRAEAFGAIAGLALLGGPTMAVSAPGTAPGAGAGGSQEPATGAIVVASTEDQVLSCAELKRHWPRLSREVRLRGHGESETEWRRRIAAEVLVESELERMALTAGLEREPDFLAAWASRRQALLLAEAERGFHERAEATPAEVEAYYEAHPERFRLEERIATRFILLKLGPDATTVEVAEATARLEEIRASFLAEGGFGELARRHSEAENAARGGVVASSTRGSLLAEYEEVAWRLEPGQVSPPARLPGGMAIVWLEQRFPAKELSLAEARPRIRKLLAERAAQRRRQEALAEARAAWPLVIDWEVPQPGPAIVFAGQPLALAELGLDHRPPRLDEEVTRAIEKRWLLRLAERRGLAGRPDVAERLADMRRAMLAGAVLEDRAASLLPTQDDEALRRVYDEKAQSLRQPELRTFEVLRVAGAEGSMRSARATADAAVELWRRSSDSTAPPRSETWRVEAWGPLARAVLGNKVSPLVARAAFELEEGEISEPIRFERYLTRSGRFVPEGYVVLRLVASSPPTVPPFDAVRDELGRTAPGADLSALRTTVRAQVRTRLAPEISVESLAACALHVPAPRAVGRRRGSAT